MERKACPSDVSDEEWALVASYLTLMTEDALQRNFPLREVFNSSRWIVRTVAQSRFSRLVSDCGRLPETLVGLHFLAFVILS
jgi:hypothetical protein